MILPKDTDLSQLVATPDLVEAAEALLSEEERERWATFRSLDRRQSFALGRHAARTLLSRRLGVAPHAVQIDVQDDGSVGVLDSNLKLSISHSGPYAVAAVSTREIGVDLERIRPRPSSLFSFILHPDEAHLRELPLAEERQIVLFWALKEAVLKAKRTGLRLSPKSLRLEIDLDRGRARIQGRRSWLAGFEIRDDHVLALAVEEPSE